MKKCIGGHAEDVQCVHCTMDPVRTGNGVPRNALGWPLSDLSQFTDIQLVAEAMTWRNAAMDTGSIATVSNLEWQKYCGELARRGLMSEMHIDAYPDLLLLDWVQPYLKKPQTEVSMRTWLDAIKWWRN